MRERARSLHSKILYSPTPSNSQASPGASAQPDQSLSSHLEVSSVLSRIISDEAFEQKIKQHAEEIVNKSHADLQAKMTQRTKQIRDYVDG